LTPEPNSPEADIALPFIHFNHPDISWEDHTARQAQSRRFLQSIDDNFLMQVVEKPTRKGALLGLVLTNKEILVEDVKVGGRLGCSDHEMVEFRSCVEEAGR